MAEFIFELREYEIIPTPSKSAAIPVSGVNDALIITAAIEAESDIFLTGDKEILALGNIGKMRIMKAGQFLDFIKSKQ